MALIMLVAMCVGLAFSLPVAIAIGITNIIGIMASNSSFLILPKEMFSAIDKFPLAAIPFFILAGNIMERGGISQRLVNFAKSIVGGVQGGLAATCVLTCMLFAAISGSSIATTFAIGAILIPALVRHGYPVNYAAALQATSAELGVIIPPSIPIILYGVTAQVSVGELFIAGFGPGILIAVALMAYVLITARRKGYGLGDHVGRLRFWVATWQAIPALLLPVIILGGIYTGAATPTEASIVAVFASLIIGVFLYRELKPRDIFPILKRSAISTAVVMFIIANAGVFSYMITRANVPNDMAAWLIANLDNQAIFLLGVNVALFVVGMFIETNSAVIVLAPILAPIAIALGIDPVHFGLVMVVNLALGMITPPFGVNLFAAAQVAGISVDKVFPPLVRFVLVVLACLAVITYFPQLTLFLRDMVYPNHR